MTDLRTYVSMYKGKEGIHWKMARDVATTEKQAELLKDQGNLYFRKEKLGAAIEAYTQVSLQNP